MLSNDTLDIFMKLLFTFDLVDDAERAFRNLRTMYGKVKKKSGVKKIKVELVRKMQNALLYLIRWGDWNHI